MSSYARLAQQEAAPATQQAARKGVAAVSLDGLVVLQIIKHCSEAFPESVAGTLLGMDVENNTLEVTHSFPSASSSDGAADGSVYELEMMKALRDVGVDNNQVGWYQSTYLGSYVTKDTIAHQYEYQESLPSSVLIVYDGVRTGQGQLAVKALRLSDAFMEAFRGRRGPGAAAAAAADALASLSPSAIFEEVPLRIRNPFPLQAALLEMATPGSALALKPAEASAPAAKASAPSGGAAALPAGVASAAGAGASSVAAAASASSSAGAAGGEAGADVDFSRLDLSSTGPFLEKHLEFLTDVTDGLLRTQMDSTMAARRAEGARRQREEWVTRRRAENEARRSVGQEPLPEEDPSLPFFRPTADARARDPLDALLMSSQIATYAGQVNRFAGATFGKLFLAQSLRKA